jgi:hypothetical protein
MTCQCKSRTGLSHYKAHFERLSGSPTKEHLADVVEKDRKDLSQGYPGACQALCDCSISVNSSVTPCLVIEKTNPCTSGRTWTLPKADLQASALHVQDCLRSERADNYVLENIVLGIYIT